MDSLVARLQDYGRNNIDVPHPERIGFVRDRTFAARLCFNAAERLVTSLDQSVVLSEHPIQRCFRDLGGMIQQIGVNWDRNMTDVIKASFGRSEEHPSELQSLMRPSSAVFCLKKKQFYPSTRRKIAAKNTNNSMQTSPL